MQRVFIASLALAGGCVAASGDESFIVRSNLSPGDGDSCELIPSLDSPSVARGQLFMDSPSPYLFNPLMESRITAAAGKESLRTIIVKGANVSLAIGPTDRIVGDQVTTDDTVVTKQFKSLFTTPLPPNGGLATGQFDLVPLSTLADIRASLGTLAADERVHVQIVATATVFGDYYGDQIEASPFEFPLTVCNDCVVNNLGICSMVAAGTIVRQGNACNPFQDGAIDCCEDDASGALVCPATVQAGL